ncbi:MAG: hypothetical protein JRI44_13840, partial [Deltaproteobacteria bacterium]|nr:hypothetical protein [Deltaproteobacteria bacterium]
NLDYFLEYVHYDPDMPDNSATANVDEGANGNAWLFGIDWDITEKINFMASYGVGDTSFQSSVALRPDHRPYNMQGAWPIGFTAGGYTLPNKTGPYAAVTDSTFKYRGWGTAFGTNTRCEEIYDMYGSGSLQAIKDLNIRVSGIFNDKCDGYLQFERVRVNDLNDLVNAVGTTGLNANQIADLRENIRAQMEYRYIEAKVKYQYKPNTSFALEYKNKTYENDFINNRPQPQLGNANPGGWSRIAAEIEVKF